MKRLAAAVCAAMALGSGSVVAQHLTPESERSFLVFVWGAKYEWAQATNDMARGAARAERDRVLCAITAQDKGAKDWVGEVAELSATQQGWGVLAIRINGQSDALLSTFNNGISDNEAHTLIKPGSPVHKEAVGLTIGQRVVFSGGFYQSKMFGCPVEISLTLKGSVEEPRFLFRFDKLKGLADRD